MTEAIQWSRRIGEVFAGKPLAVVALYNEAKIELVRGRYNEAVELLTRLQAQPIYPRLVSAPIRGEAAFLRILALEKMGRLSEAAQLYMAIPDERENYFGHRATERLLAIGRTEPGPPHHRVYGARPSRAGAGGASRRRATARRKTRPRARSGLRKTEPPSEICWPSCERATAGCPLTLRFRAFG